MQKFQHLHLPCVSFATGADRHTVFTNKDFGEKDIAGDSGLRGQLRMPKDLCVALTEESSGSVFNRCVRIAFWIKAHIYFKIIDDLSFVISN